MLKILSSILSSQEKIESWATSLEVLSLIAVAITIFFGWAVIGLRKESSKIDKREKNELNLTIAQLNLATKESEENIANLNKENLKLKIELEKLKISTGDRFIPDFMFSELKIELEKYKGKFVRFNIIGSNEVNSFANSLMSLFKQSSWQYSIGNRTGIETSIGGSVQRGIVIISHGEKNNKIAEFICNKFISFGYLCKNNSVGESKIDIEITIAPK